MKKWGLLTVILALAAPAFAGSGDHVLVQTQDGNTVVTLSGSSDSAAAEIFASLGRAGVPESAPIPSQVFSGNLIQGALYYVHGEPVYDANLTIDSTSYYGLLPNRCAPANHCPDAKTHLILGGHVASELYNDLVKAGDPETHGVDNGSVVGKALSCSYFIVGGIRYTCNISLSDVH